MNCRYILNFIILCGVAVSSSQVTDETLVKIEQGWLGGEILKPVIGNKYYYSFKGIPYAKPPVGSLRFKAPQDPEPWSGVLMATQHGPVCPQVDLLSNTYIPGSEDCLFLNVYSPSLTPRKLKPVMFFIHGGCFKFGSGNVDIYGPDFLVTKDVVLVTINYRLDALGFLSTGTKEIPGNAAMKDQVKALQWVQKNIKKFGGDPRDVTIIGESAGGASVSLHLVSPMSKGLFKRAVLQSGVFSLDTTITYQPVARAFALGKSLGINTKNSKELLNFLQKVPYKLLVNTTSTILASEEITNLIFKLIPFAPVVEEDYGQERFLIEDPFISMESNNVNSADVMLSYTSEESLIMLQFYIGWHYIDRYNKYPELFVPSKILINSPPDIILKLSDKIINHYFGNKTVSVSNMREFTNYANYANIVYDVYRFIRRWPKYGNTFLFKFNGISSRNYFGNQGAQYGIKGVSHYEDLFYIFDPKSLSMPITKNSREYDIVNLITTVLTNFAKYGNPTPDSSLGIKWPHLYSTANLAYVEMDNQLTIDYAPEEADIIFWKSIFEEAGLVF